MRVFQVVFCEGFVHRSNLSMSSGFETSMQWGPTAPRIQSSKAGILGSTSYSALHFLHQTCILNDIRVNSDYENAKI
jgi:hypothetical protein